MRAVALNATTWSAAAIAFVRRAHAVFGQIPDAAMLLAARIFPAAVFWYSGRTKVDGWSVSENARFLFEYEYALPLISPVLAAWLATIAEHLFPILLVLGLATRFSALALLCMTLVIQIVVYPAAWPTHGVWAACFLIVIARGPGPVSLDRLLLRRDA